MALPSPFAWLGAATLIAIAAGVVDAISPFLRPSRLHRYLHAKDGKPAWALVTGASDGIGKALSHELAAAGFNVVLHGRNAAKLERAQRDLEAAYPAREFRLLIADALNCAPEVFDDIISRFADVHLTVLVSNAGGAGQTADLFRTLDGYSPRQLADIISLNAVFPTMLAAALIPALARNAPALLISIGSLSDGGLPLLGSYGAAKGYHRVLFEAVAREMRIARRDVEVVHMRLGSVTGVSHTWVKPSVFEPHSSTVAKAVLARVGCGRAVIAPYWGHALQSIFTDWFPWWLKDIVFIQTMVKLQTEGLNPQKKMTDQKKE